MPTVRVWNGSSWVDKDQKADFSYWSGANWEEPADVRMWNGVAWNSVFGAAPGAGITLRTVSSATDNNVNTLSVSIPGSVQVGDFLVLTVAQTTSVTPLFNEITGWTKQGEQRAGGAGGASFVMGVYTRVAQGGDAGSTVTSTSSSIAHYSGQLRVYAGVNTTTPLDTAVEFSFQNPASTSASAPAINVVNTGSMLIALYGLPTITGTTLTIDDWTAPTGFSNGLVTCPPAGSGNRPCIALFDRITPGTGAQGPFTATTIQSRLWATATLALRPE